MVPQNHRLRERTAGLIWTICRAGRNRLNMQRNWIGRSEGIDLSFVTEHDASQTFDGIYHAVPIRCWATYVAVASEHPLALAAETDAEIAAFIEQCKQNTTSEPIWPRWKRKASPLWPSIH